MKKIILLGTIHLLTLFSISVNASDSNTSFNLNKVEDGVFVHIGKHASIEDPQHDDIANIGFIIGDNCIAVIDSGGSVTIGKRLLSAIRSISDKPICYVINTHIHFDHILGNKVFESNETIFVGHHKLAEAVEQNRSFFLEQFKADLGENPNNESIIGPTLLVEEKHELDLGNRKLQLTAFPVSHSHNDLTVLDEKTGTMWAGDLIFRERIPSLTGSIKGWVKVMDELRTLNVKKVIPGHGHVANSMDEAIEQQENYLVKLLNETRKAIADGLFVNDAVEVIDKENQQQWKLHDYQHSANVSKAFTELEWE